ncbi:hypothetical protein [Halomarina litorea]|uniref:hypothetical protein n=1 Tax=Halomarina litorea TaxID=2961595 RepID=UPI0020C1FADA|nr:hypothetical protein [Halomarina sp. BCD28]
MTEQKELTVTVTADTEEAIRDIEELTAALENLGDAAEEANVALSRLQLARGEELDIGVELTDELRSSNLQR